MDILAQVREIANSYEEPARETLMRLSQQYLDAGGTRATLNEAGVMICACGNVLTITDSYGECRDCRRARP